MWGYLEQLDDFLWNYIGFPAAFLIGIWLTFRSRGFQIRQFPRVCRTFLQFLCKRDQKNDSEAAACTVQGVHPLKLFFAGLGGCVGIGNIVAITTAVQIGGPGAVFWMWGAAIFGAIIKYSEVFLGLRFRVTHCKDGFCGGPMYFLSKAIAPWASTLFCILMCLYGVEIFQFSVVTHSVSTNFGVDKLLVTAVLLLLVALAEMGGVRRIGSICSAIIPLFICVYLVMGIYALFCCRYELPAMFTEIFTSAFTPKAACGSFIGTTLLLTISQGLRRGYYSSDVGVGYASIIHSASREKDPARQAGLVIFEVFLDTFVICTMSVFLVLLTGLWKEAVDPMLLVQQALGMFFPYMQYFMPFFLLLLGYSTIITFFCAGVKTAEFLHPQYGRRIYYAYAMVVLFSFSFVETSQAMIPMSIVQLLLLVLNLAAICRLRKEISFDISVQETDSVEVSHAYRSSSI